LESAIPYNVGFIGQVTASRDTTELHKARISNYLPPDAPKFQVGLHRIYGNDGRTSYFMMIQSSEKDITTLSQMLIEINDSNKIVYFPWNHFVSLPNTQKQTIIVESRKWDHLFKSICVSGFKDNNDDIKMNYILDMGEDEEVDVYHRDTTITDFLFSLEHPITKNKMFEYVYPTILGTKEFIVSTISSGDTEAYLKMLVGELARDMSIDAINEEFADPMYARQQANNAKWKAFSKACMIADTAVENQFNNNKNFKNHNHNKRTRTFKEKDHYYSNGNTSNSTHTTTYTPVTPNGGTYLQRATNGTSTNSCSGSVMTSNTEVTQLQNQYYELQNTVTILKGQVANAATETKDNTKAIHKLTTTVGIIDVKVTEHQGNSNLQLDKLYALINDMNDNFNTTMEANQKITSGQFNDISTKIDTKKHTVAQVSAHPVVLSPTNRHLTRSQTKLKRLSGEVELLEDLNDNAMDESYEETNKNKENMELQVTNENQLK
jgi:hypothetical protein